MLTSRRNKGKFSTEDKKKVSFFRGDFIVHNLPKK
eukprot:05889.XXX_27812_27916_1 [CDS] Oithona nana genome sequencing.